VDCEALVGKSFRLDGEEWEVIEAEATALGLLSMRDYAKVIRSKRSHHCGRAGRGHLE
jgi:hypothetical protein